jgi:hypothetical protein
LYGVPADLDLAVFEGATLVSVDVGEFHLRFEFSRPGEAVSLGAQPSIGVEGKWELRDGAGTVIDNSMPNSERGAYRVHRILGREVVGTELNPPLSFALRFDDGHALAVFDDSVERESFTIQPGDVIV